MVSSKNHGNMKEASKKLFTFNVPISNYFIYERFIPWDKFLNKAILGVGVLIHNDGG